jgi:hypothetical protein
MSDEGFEAGRSLEETPEVAAAVRDETTVPQLAESGPADDARPVFVEPADAPPSDGAPPQP